MSGNSSKVEVGGFFRSFEASFAGMVTE
ncbi:MAG: hypothetical protein RL181_591, partial [Bacteroidota bacterium]